MFSSDAVSHSLIFASTTSSTCGHRLENALERAISASLRSRGGLQDAEELLRDVADALEGKRASERETEHEELGGGKERGSGGPGEQHARWREKRGMRARGA
eukprot:763315-Hanusia_phi.AAC.3